MSQAEILDRFVADEMRAALGSAVIGREIIVLDQTGSTNDAVLQIATPYSKEGLVLFAEHQTAGRGQRGNRWESAAAKGLWFSILLRPGIELNRSPQLTAWAAETMKKDGLENVRKEPVKVPTSHLLLCRLAADRGEDGAVGAAHRLPVRRVDQAGQLELGHGPAVAPAPATTVPALTTTSARLTPRW